jgi:hypothetical protein
MWSSAVRDGQMVFASAQQTFIHLKDRIQLLHGVVSMTCPSAPLSVVPDFGTMQP